MEAAVAVVGYLKIAGTTPSNLAMLSVALGHEPLAQAVEHVTFNRNDVLTGTGS